MIQKNRKNKIKSIFSAEAVFSTELPVTVGDLNYGNHLGHVQLVSLLHEARVRFLKSLNFAEHDVGGLGLILVKLEVNYRAQGFYGDILTINVVIGKMANSSFEFLYEVKNKATGQVLAEANTVMVCFDYEKQKTKKIPPIFIRAVKTRFKI